jgi:DNA repair protein RadD
VGESEAEKPAAELSAHGLLECSELGGRNSSNAILPVEENQAAERGLRPLRAYQEQALDALRGKLKSGVSRLILQLPTGAGKTLLSAHIISRALIKGRRVAFVVPALSLIDQTVRAFEAEGISAIGVMQGIHERTDRDQPVQVCSVQTVARRKRPDVDLVIVDEAHQLHREIFRWMKDCPAIPFIGLSATPWARGLGRYYDDLIIAATTAELIRDGFLSPSVAYAPSNPDLSSVSTVAGEFNQGELGDAMDLPQITGDIVQTWLQRGESRPTLAYCVNRKHAQHVAERFIEAGVTCEYMDGETPREEREETFDRFRSGETKIICNVGVLTTGIDLPNASCLVDAKPTKSKMLFVQTVGRGLRVAEGKSNCIILDHAGNHLRLGMVTDIGQDHLDDGKERQRQSSTTKTRERSAPLPHACSHCKAVIPYKAKQCPACGEPVIATTTVRTAEGTLVELGSLRSGAIEPTIAEQAEFFGELKWVATVRGYAQGWAAHKFKERFGFWPNNPRIRAASPREPSLKTTNWLRSRSIAFAKRRSA